MDINSSVLHLGRMRKVHADKKKRLAALQEEFDREHEELIASIKTMATDICYLENGIRQEAVDAFKVTGAKHFDSGVAIKMFTVFNYERDKAFAWAKEHLMALKLDETAFEKHAKLDKPDFVEIIEEPRATIPTKIMI